MHCIFSIIFNLGHLCYFVICARFRSGGQYMVAATAFSLALFSHILNHVVIRLQSNLYELENPRKSIEVPSEGLQGLLVKLASVTCSYYVFCDFLDEPESPTISESFVVSDLSREHSTKDSSHTAEEKSSKVFHALL